MTPIRFLGALLATVIAGSTLTSAQCTSPYTLPKFQAAIAECKLQAPDSSTYFTQAQLIAGSCDDVFFKVADTDKMAFYQTGDSMRTELRYENNWYVNSSNRTAHGNIRVVSQTCDQVTIMQIHDDANPGSVPLGPNKPLLRIYRHLNRNSTGDRIWAAIKTDSGGVNTTHVDLGATPAGYFDCDITINMGTMTIAIDGTIIDTRDVSFWVFPSYWKAGAYLQDPGEATVYFNELTWPATATNQPPSFNTDPVNEVTASEAIAYNSTLTNDAFDPESDTMTFSKISGPAWLNVASNGTLSGTPTAGDVGLNTFTVQVDATGGSDTATLNINVLSASLVELTNDDFESGWGNWTDGGTDALLSSSFAIGSQCFNLQDDTSTSTATLTNSLNLTTYPELQVHFSFVAQSFENGESFFVEYSDNGGSSWSTVKEYVVDVDFANDGTRYNPILILDDTGYNFSSTAKIRFRCDGSNNSDDVYIDNVVIYGDLGSTVNLPPSFTSDPINEINATEDDAYSSTIADDASDPETDPLTFSKISGPAWLSVAPNGTLSGTPSSGDLGANIFTVQVDATGGSDTATLNITVDATSTAGTVTIVDDSFADGNRANTGSLQADWWSSSSTSGNSVEAYTGQLGLVTGTSGRGIHGTFNPQTLAIDDTLTATLTFTTPATVGTARSSALKLALMDFNNAGLAADLSSSSMTVNPLYTNLPGYFVDFDVNTGASANTQLREHTTPNSTGRFLGTTTEWTNLGTSPNAGYTFSPNTEYVIVLSVTRTGADSADIFSSLSQGGSLLDSHTASDASIIANNFGMLGIWSNSNTFGSTNAAGSSADNGLTFSNIKVELVTPEAPNQPPSFTTDLINEVNATQSAAYSSTLANDASDPEADPMTFSKLSGPAWLNVAANGALTGTPSNSDVDLNVFTVQVDATGGSDTATLNITVDNINDPPVASDGSGSVAENSSVGTLVATLVVSDPDLGTIFSGSITAGNIGGAFALNSSNGEITVAGPLDFENLDSYSLTVEVTDNGIPQLSDTANITISITNVIENDQEVITLALTGPGDPFPGETDLNIIGVGADPDQDGNLNFSEVWRGTDADTSDQPTPLTLEAFFIAGADRGSVIVETDSVMDDALAIGVEMSHDLTSWRDITNNRLVLTDAGGTRTLRFYDTIALPSNAPLFVRFSDDPTATP